MLFVCFGPGNLVVNLQSQHGQVIQILDLIHLPHGPLHLCAVFLLACCLLVVYHLLLQGIMVALEPVHRVLLSLLLMLESAEFFVEVLVLLELIF